MADTLDTPSFSIQDTMELGTGSKELLAGLYAPETASTDPEKIEKIDPEKKSQKPAPPAKKDEKEGKKEDKKEDPNKPLKTFLEEEEEEEEVEEGEEPKKTSKKEGEEEEEEQETEEGKEDNRFSALAKDLFKLGVFSKGADEEDVAIESPQDLLDRFNLEKKKGAMESIDRFIGQFGEDYQAAFDAIYVKGVDPKEYFTTYNNIDNIASLDLKDESNQILIIKQALADQGYEAEDITTEVERIKNYGDLETVAQRHHKTLIKKEAAKLEQMKKDSETKLQQLASVKNQFATNVRTVLQNKLKTSEFDGIPLNPTLATELQDFLVTDKYKTPSGETLTEFDKTILELKRPENHEKKVKIALLLKILEKDPTLSTIQKSAITKKSNTLFTELARNQGKSSVKSSKTEKPSSWFS